MTKRFVVKIGSRQKTEMTTKELFSKLVYSQDEYTKKMKIFNYVMNEVNKNKKIIEKTKIGEENIVIRIDIINDYITEYTDIYFKRIK